MDKRVYSILLELAKANSAEIRARGDLKPRNNDSEDFISIPVWGIEKMLESAYTVGTMVGERMSEYPEYQYDWKTVDQVMANLETPRRFNGVAMKLSEISVHREDYELAEQIWKKIRKEFNREAKNFDEENSIIGSVGMVKDREVMRTMWWNAFTDGGNENYETITSIIEALHDGEKLSTGRITFGS